MQDFPLSFCIPTYKRPEFLFKAVESIREACIDYSREVQIVIVDDSTDETNTLVIERIKAKIKNFKYIKNGSNLGIDQNILHAIDSSDGEFVWVLGEDDLVCQNAVKDFLSITRREDYGFICSNYSYVDSEHKNTLKRNVIDISTNKKVKSLELLEKYSWSFGFIGACIINKKVWQTIDSRKYVGTFFAHVGTILEAVKDKEILILSTPSILNRCGDSNITTWGVNQTFEVVNGWSTLMKRLNFIYSENSCNIAYQQFEKKLGVNSLSFLFSKRADGVYTKEVYQKFYKDSKRGWLYHLVALMILCLSPKICRVIRLFRRKIKRNI
jgi:glycosyltransferase involved in cell wall biosynthesis